MRCASRSTCCANFLFRQDFPSLWAPCPEVLQWGLEVDFISPRRKSRPAEWVGPKNPCEEDSTLTENQSPAILGRCYTGSFQTLYRLLYIRLGTAVAQWLRRCATNREVAGSIPDGVIGIFHWHHPSDRTMALESTQPLTEMSTRSISWG